MTLSFKSWYLSIYLIQGTCSSLTCAASKQKLMVLDCEMLSSIRSALFMRILVENSAVVRVARLLPFLRIPIDSNVVSFRDTNPPPLAVKRPIRDCWRHLLPFKREVLQKGCMRAPTWGSGQCASNFFSRWTSAFWAKQWSNFFSNWKKGESNFVLPLSCLIRIRPTKISDILTSEDVDGIFFTNLTGASPVTTLPLVCLVPGRAEGRSLWADCRKNLLAKERICL